MMLVMQIALGIVLGVLILRYLRQIVTIGVVGAVVVAVAVLAVLTWSAVTNHWDVAAPMLGGVAFVVLIGFAIQYSARGLGYLYVTLRPSIAPSRRWRNLLRLLGVHESWLTSEQPRPYIARVVGDALFMG